MSWKKIWQYPIFFWILYSIITSLLYTLGATLPAEIHSIAFNAGILISAVFGGIIGTIYNNNVTNDNYVTYLFAGLVNYAGLLTTLFASGIVTNTNTAGTTRMGDINNISIINIIIIVLITSICTAILSFGYWLVNNFTTKKFPKK